MDALLQLDLIVNGRSANDIVDTGCTSKFDIKTWSWTSRIQAIDEVRCNGTNAVHGRQLTIGGIVIDQIVRSVNVVLRMYVINQLGALQ